MFKTKIKYIFEVLKDCRIEIFCFILHFGMLVQSSVVTQLMEDKLCLNKYGFSQDICREIGSSNDTNAKSLVLKDVSIIKGYKSTLNKIPHIITTLFVGAWINNYPDHLKFIISLSCIQALLNIFVLTVNTLWFTLDVKFLYANDLLSWIFPAGSHTALQTYIVLTNPPQKRIIKFVAIGVADRIAGLLGEIAGGWILAQPPWFPNQFKNYLGIYAVSFAFKGGALLWLVMEVPSVHRLNEKRIAKNPEHGAHGLPTLNKDVDKNGESNKKSFRSSVLSVSALVNLFKILTKYREGGRRFVLWIMVLSGFIFSMEFSFLGSINYQFYQKAYHWSNFEYSKYHALTNIFPTIVQMLGPKVLIEGLGFSDVNLAIIALLSHAASKLLTGLWLNSTGYVAATIVGSLSGLYHASSQSILCNVIDHNEIGGLFSVTSILSTILTLGSDQVLIRIFNIFLDSYPGFPFVVFAPFTLAPLSVMLYIKLKAPHLAGEVKSKQQTSDEDGQNKENPSNPDKTYVPQNEQNNNNSTKESPETNENVKSPQNDILNPEFQKF